MQCPSCHHMNQPRARFCAACGSRLLHAPPPAALGIRPNHLAVLAGAAICLLALFLVWEPASATSRQTYTQHQAVYADGSTAWNEYLPEAEITYHSGVVGLDPVKLAAVLFMGGTALGYRAGGWPNWARYALAAVNGFILLVGLTNAAYHLTAGPMIFLAGSGLAAWGTITVLRSRPGTETG